MNTLTLGMAASAIHAQWLQQAGCVPKHDFEARTLNAATLRPGRRERTATEPARRALVATMRHGTANGREPLTALPWHNMAVGLKPCQGCGGGLAFALYTALQTKVA